MSLRDRLRSEPFWLFIALFALVSSGLYLYHLSTGFTPDRVAFTLPVFDFAVYWYGIIITGGIVLGAYVVAFLARQRARDLFQHTVPAQVRQRGLDDLALPAEIDTILSRRGVDTMGALLFQLAFGREALGVNAAGMTLIREQLANVPDVEVAWVDKPAWAAWNPNHVWSGLVWSLLFAFVGARLYHVLTPPPSFASFGIESPADYFRHPMILIDVRRGGLGIYGGIVGGALGLMIFTYRQRIPWLSWADIAVVGLALGQYVGRWGNFVNQELYGRPTDLPWGVWIDHPVEEYASFARFHPAFLYESLWSLLAFFSLYFLARHSRHRYHAGDTAALYLILYAVGRSLVDTVRLDNATVSLGAIDTRLPIATLVSLVIALFCSAWLIYRHRGVRS